MATSRPRPTGPAKAVDPLDAGRRALEDGRWAAASDAFRVALATDPGAEAFDGLGRARWWLKDVPGALEARTRSYAELRRAGRFDDAARVAVWLSREHRTLLHQGAVADGWLARARTTSALGQGWADGWIHVAQAEIEPDASTAIALLGDAVALARQAGDPDLEIAALALLGLGEVKVGRVDDGIARLDEAMAAATAGEGTDPQSIGEAFCALMEVAGLLGGNERLAHWATALERFRADHDFAPLLAYGAPASAADSLNAYCGSCCGGIHLVTGRLADAEGALQAALDDLRRRGMHSRCLHPAVQLAQLRLAQGRLEDAETLLREFGDEPSCVRAMAELDLARGNPAEAVARLRAGIAALGGQELVAFPLWTLAVDAELARGDLGGAEEAVAVVQRVAGVTASRRHRAMAAFAQAKVGHARGDADAPQGARAAATALAAVDLPLEAARARMLYAATLVEDDLPTAVTEAKAALLALDNLGAVTDADRAAAFLKGLGVQGRTGPRNEGLLSRRQQQVLRLLSHGLTNVEIAERLDISVKTSGHHVSAILNRLGLRSRTEAAAWAMLNLPRDV